MDKIKKIIDNLKTQDNLCMGDPIFIVQQKKEIIGLDPAYSDEVIWLDENNEYEEITDPEKIKELNEYYDCTFLERRGYTRTAKMETWEFVTACLTRKGCEDYIAAMKHRLKEPRIFVDSGYRNAEWIALREYFLNK